MARGMDVGIVLGMDESTRRRIARQQDPLPFLEIHEDGTRTRKDLKREEILEIARAALPELTQEEFEKVTKEDFSEDFWALNWLRKRPRPAMNEEELIERRKSLVRMKGTLRLRDIRLLDPLFVLSRDPEIRVRRHAIIVNLQPVRALVLHNKALLLYHDEDDDPVIQGFLEYLDESEQDEASDSFSMLVLEGLFEVLCSLLGSEVTEMQPAVVDTVSSILQKQSGITIQELRQCKMAVSKMVSKIQAVQSAFAEVLRSDRDMALMRLSRVHAFPQLYKDKNEPQWSLDHEEVELLLENYAQQLDASLWQVIDLKEDLQEAMNATVLRLDSARNKLLSVELLVACVTSAAAIGALIAGLFGMNLNSGVENASGWFWGWFAAVVVTVPVVVIVAFYAIYRSGLLIT